MGNVVERVGDTDAELGEGPVWDPREAVLWWLDIPGARLHRTDPATGATVSTELGQQVGALAVRDSGGLVLATPDGFVAFDPATGRRELLAPVEADDGGTRMNDGKCDSRGRFWAGTMAYDFRSGAGSFYRLDPDGTVTTMLTGVTISNGLGWSADEKTMYYIDTMTGLVEAFDFDVDQGSISNRRPVVKITEGDGLPDGMCVDAEGCLWVALYGGSAVHRYRPDGSLDRIVELPVVNVTCCAFGGPDLSDLYITTGGGLYRCRPGVQGTPAHTYAG